MLRVQFNYFIGLIMVGALLVCAGCGESKLDTSNDQAFATSLEKVYSSVPEDEREAFLGYLNMVMEGKVRVSFFTGKRETPTYDDIVQMYSLVKAMGKEKDQKMITNLNGLTRSEVVAKGKAILKKDLEERQAGLKKQMDEIQKQIEAEKKLEMEPQKVEVYYAGVDVREGINFEKKSWGTVGSIAALITVKNNSSEPVRRINGKVIFSDESGNIINDASLASLRPVDQADDAYIYNLKIAPGEEWKGKVVLRFFGPDKKHPYPPTREYTAAISDVKVVLDADMPWSGSIRSNEKRLEILQKSLQGVESELAAQK